MDFSLSNNFFCDLNGLTLVKKAAFNSYSIQSTYVMHFWILTIANLIESWRESYSAIDFGFKSILRMKCFQISNVNYSEWYFHNLIIFDTEKLIYHS